MTPDVDGKYFQRGRQRLKELLPACRAAAKNDADGWKTGKPSTLFRALIPHMREDNLEALVIYPAPLGGFHADLVFKKVPVGVTNTIGSPSHMPCPTFLDAEIYAKGLLTMVLAIEMRTVRSDEEITPAEPSFELHGWSCPLMSDALEKMKEAAGDELGPVPPAERLCARLVDELTRIFGSDTFDGAVFNALPQQKKIGLVAVMHMAALRGIMRYPLNVDAPPPEHVGKVRPGYEEYFGESAEHPV